MMASKLPYINKYHSRLSGENCESSSMFRGFNLGSKRHQESNNQKETFQIYYDLFLTETGKPCVVWAQSLIMQYPQCTS